MMLFSQIRKQSEFSKYLEGRNTGHKRINKYAKHCQFLKAPVNVSTMCTLYVNTVFKHPNFFRVQQEIDTISICKQYTHTLVAYWKVLLKNQCFKLFIPSCLYLMRSGVCVDGVYVIDQCAQLDKILPEASTLDLYGIQKAQFTHTKNLILKEIRQHVPSELRDKIKSVCRDMARNGL